MISRPCHQHYFYIWLSQPQPIFLSQPQNEQKVSRNSKYSQNILGLSLKETADCQNNCFIQIFSFLNPEHLIFFCEIGFLNMLLLLETRDKGKFLIYLVSTTQTLSCVSMKSQRSRSKSVGRFSQFPQV